MRTIRVLVFLVASMTVGAGVLMLLDPEGLSAGPFSLSSYTRLNSINQVAIKPIGNNANLWNKVEVFYSNTTEGNLSSLSKMHGLTSPKDLNFHMIICNGDGGQDGQIVATNNWKKQLALLPSNTWIGSSQTIRICLVADGIMQIPTDSQIKRAVGLVEQLSRRCNIAPENIRYPANWQF